MRKAAACPALTDVMERHREGWQAADLGQHSLTRQPRSPLGGGRPASHCPAGWTRGTWRRSCSYAGPGEGTGTRGDMWGHGGDTVGPPPPARPGPRWSLPTCC